jgi:hypothetical protein
MAVKCRECRGAAAFSAWPLASKCQARRFHIPSFLQILLVAAASESHSPETAYLSFCWKDQFKYLSQSINNRTTMTTAGMRQPRAAPMVDLSGIILVTACGALGRNPCIAGPFRVCIYACHTCALFWIAWPILPCQMFHNCSVVWPCINVYVSFAGHGPDPEDSSDKKDMPVRGAATATRGATCHQYPILPACAADWIASWRTCTHVCSCH